MNGSKSDEVGASPAYPASSAGERNAKTNISHNRSVNFDDSIDISADLNNSGYYSPNSSANFGTLTQSSPRPNAPSRQNSGGSARSQLLLGNNSRGSSRPGLARNTTESVRSGSFRNESYPKESGRNDLLQTMRSVQGLKPKVSVRKYSVGGMRFASEKRQIAGMMLILGLACVFQPLYSICSLIGSGGTTRTSGVVFAILFGDFCILLLGIMAVGIGFAEFVVEFGHERYTTALLLLAQTGFIWVISSMTSVGRIAAGPVGFIPQAYAPSTLMNRFLGAMGIIAIGAYGFAMIGSVTFMGFSLYAFQVLKPHDRDRDYYMSRAAIYSAALFLAGLSQFLIGIFIIEVYGMMLSSGPIQIGFILVNIPVITTLIGVVQAVAGLWGFLRSFGLFVKGRTDNRYQLAMGVIWTAQLVLQGVVQSAYLPAGEGAGLASTIAGLSFALNFMPFYLDYKVRMTLKRLKPGYFGLVEDEDMPSDDEAGTKSIGRKSNTRESTRSTKHLARAEESA